MLTVRIKKIKRKAYLFSIVFLLYISFISSCKKEDTLSVDLDEKKVIFGSDKRDVNELRFGIGAMLSPQKNIVYYGNLVEYISRKMNMRAKIVQRRTYEEMNDMLRFGGVDVAFICSGAYIRGESTSSLRLIAVPVIKGKKTYNSLIITNSRTNIKDVRDMRGKRVAFVDTISNTGRLYPLFYILKNNYEIAGFFGQIYFTGSHDRSIEMVINGEADVAGVDSIIFDYYFEEHPSCRERIRVIHISPDFGIPPLVAGMNTPEWLVSKIKGIVLQMHLDNEGKEILKSLHFDRFEPAEPELYNSLKEMYLYLKERGIGG